MATEPDLDLVNAIDTALATLTLGTDLFRGVMRAVGPGSPNEAVAVLATGGPQPLAYLDGTAIERYFSALQIRIRSIERSFRTGQALARSVRDVAHHASIAGYIDTRVLESEPLYLGSDDEGNHEWSINVEMWHEQ